MEIIAGLPERFLFFVQEEVDTLTKRAKSAEVAFLNVVRILLHSADRGFPVSSRLIQGWSALSCFLICFSINGSTTPPILLAPSRLRWPPSLTLGSWRRPRLSLPSTEPRVLAFETRR